MWTVSIIWMTSCCLGVPGASQCGDSLCKALARCESLGVPVAPTKTEGPATKMVFLGILMDTVSMTLSLPQAKLDRLRAMILRAALSDQAGPSFGA